MNSNFSVLLSLYYKEDVDYFNECMFSLLSQSVQSSDIVLVLDGPLTDSLEEKVSYWEKKLPLNIVRLEKNVGLSRALNIGLSYCKFDLVARMDTDDICHPSRFERQLNEFKRCGVDVCGTYAIDIDEHGNEINTRVVPTSHDKIKKLIWSCPIIHPSVMFKKESIISVGSYNKSAPHRQDDYELWIRCVDKGLRFSNIPEYLVYYRYPEGSEKKNTLSVGINRFRLGIRPAIKYDFGGRSILGLLYPILRSVLPQKINRYLLKIVSRLDPRRK